MRHRNAPPFPRDRTAGIERQHRSPTKPTVTTSEGAEVARRAQGWAERERVAFAAHRRVHETCRERNRSDRHGDAWRVAAGEFHAVMDAVYPPDFQAARAALQERRPTDPTPLIAFLEADPLFFGSGYTKESLIRLLKRADLTETQAEGWRGVVLAAATRPEWRREDRHYGRLARKVDSPGLRAALENLRQNGPLRERVRAGWFLHALNS